MFPDLWPQGTRGVLLLVRRKFERHNNLGLDLYYRTPRFLGHPLAPPLLESQVAYVADDKRGAFAIRKRHLVRGALVNDELYAAFFETLLYVLQTF